MGRENIQLKSANIDPTSQHHNAPIATILRSLGCVTRQDLRHAFGTAKGISDTLSAYINCRKDDHKQATFDRSVFEIQCV